MTLNVSNGLEDAGNIRWITQRCLPASVPYSIVGLTVSLSIFPFSVSGSLASSPT